MTFQKPAIPVGTHLSYAVLKDLLRDHYCDPKLLASDHISFDLTHLERFELAEISMLFNWAAGYVYAGTSVTWEFPTCTRLSDSYFDIERSRRPLSYEEVLRSIEARIGATGAREVRNRFEYIERNVHKSICAAKNPHVDFQYVNSLETKLSKKYIDVRAEIHKLAECLRNMFRGMRLIGFADRLGLLGLLEQIGCLLLPADIRKLAWPYSQTTVTGTLPYRCISSDADVHASTQEFGSGDEMRRVFKSYAELDVIRGGALSNIIIQELGVNVVEHASASMGLLATRVVGPSQMRWFHDYTIGSKQPNFFRSVKHVGFLEVVVADDGIGIPVALRQTLVEDCKQRMDLQEQYAIQNESFDKKDIKDWHVLDFAFDRLSSSKRNAKELFEIPWIRETSDKGDMGLILQRKVGSGLFWVWNLVRTFGGFLMVRSGGSEVSYDFSERCSGGGRSPNVAEYPMSGTQVWLCLPLMKESSVKKGWSGTVADDEHIQGQDLYFHWVGSLTSELPVQDFLEHPDDRRLAELYEQIKVAFEKSASRNSMLVLDLSGSHKRWFHNNCRYIANAVLELNYLAPAGTHSTVLFNAPSGGMDVLLPIMRQHCEELAKAQPELSRLRLATTVFWDDGKSVSFISPNEHVARILKVFGESGQDLSAVDIRMSLDRKQGIRPSVEEIERILTENGHIVAETQPALSERRFRLKFSQRFLCREANRFYASELKRLSQSMNLQGMKPGESDDCAFVRRGKENEEVFWLPSSAKLATDFFQVGVLASNAMWRARIGWLLAQEVRRIEIEQASPVAFLVSTTRSTPHFLEEARQFLGIKGSPPDLIIEDDIHGLQETLDKLGSQDEGDIGRPLTILFTDVISTGRLIKLTSQLLLEKGLDVRSIFAVADIRTQEDVKDSELPVKPVALLREEVKKWKPSEVNPATKRIDIDQLEVCPVGQVPPSLWDSVQEGMWILGPTELLMIAASQKALLTGHYHIGEYHHYVYYLVADWVLGAIWPGAKHTVRTELEARIKTDLASYSPESIVVLYPDPRVSRCKCLVDLICRVTDARWRHILYRDRFGPRWSYSAFVEHGVPIEDKNVVLMDDGTCTGDTLVALAETAALGGARSILAYFLVDRMPLVKSDLLARLDTLRGEKGKCVIKLRALGGLQIPVYAREACPVCAYRRDMNNIAENYITLGRAARSIAEALEPFQVPSAPSESEEHFQQERLPWYVPKDVSILWRIRQALEYYPYEVPSGEKDVGSSLGLLDAMTRNEEGLLALAFMTCVEPRLSEKKWFCAQAQMLIDKWIDIVGQTGGEDKVARTVTEAIFNLEAAGQMMEYPRETLPLALAKRLSNTDFGRKVAEHLMLIIARAATRADSAMRAEHWAAQISEYAEKTWNTYPLRRARSVLRQTLYLGRSLGGLKIDLGASLEQLYARSARLLDFFCHHRTTENIEGPIWQTLRELAVSNSATMSFQRREGIERILNRLEALITLLEGLCKLETAIHHPLMPVCDGQKRDAIEGLCQLQDAVLELLESPSKENAVRVMSEWHTSGAVISDFFEWLFADVYDCVRRTRDLWQDKNDWAGEIFLYPEATNASERAFSAFLPAQLIEHFVELSLDNIKDRAYPNAEEREHSEVSISIKKHDRYIAIEFCDKGLPFEPQTQWEHTSLGKFAKEILPFEAKLERPQKGDREKRFILKLLSCPRSGEVAQ